MRIPRVAIVITTYLEATKPYLDLCLRSIEALNYPKDCLSVHIVCPPDYVPAINDDGSPRYGKAWSIFAMDEHGGKDYSNAHAINVGIEAALRGKPDFVVYANDDVIFQRESLQKMVVVLRNNPKLLLMPISNDGQQRFVAGLALPPGPYKIEDTVGREQMIINQDPPPLEALFFYDTLCTYVMAFTPQLWLDVGPLNETFRKVGPDDIDHTIRVKRAGYQPAIYTGAVVYHAGGVTSELTLSESDREFNRKALDDKWGVNA